MAPVEVVGGQKVFPELSLEKEAEYDRVVCFKAKTLACQPPAETQLQY